MMFAGINLNRGQNTYSGQAYNTVLIGAQCWLKENLNVGVMILGSQNQTDNSQIEKYCLYNDTINCYIYGGLYQWDELMQYSSGQGSQGICPSGWYIPTYSDWETLIYNLGGQTVAGGKLKETGTIHWAPPNTGATNESGFTAFPGGIRLDWGFSSMSTAGYFSTSTQYNSSMAYVQVLNHNKASINTGYNYKIYGHSGRCIKD
jgi:uncharacterized protein (TIGR02145 family)